jgi:hypothetical protein
MNGKRQALLLLTATFGVACKRPDPAAAETSPTVAESSAPSAAATTSSPPSPSLPVGKGADSFELVTAANLDGAPGDEVVAYGAGRYRVYRLDGVALREMDVTPLPGAPAIPGAPQLMTAADLDGDGRDEVLIGYGQSRTERTPPITLAALRLLTGEPARTELRVLH